MEWRYRIRSFRIRLLNSTAQGFANSADIIACINLSPYTYYMLLFKFWDLQRIEHWLSRTANHSTLEIGNSEEVWRFSFIFWSPAVDKSFLPPHPLSAARVLLPSTYGMRRRKRRSATGIGCLAVMATEKEERMRKGFSISRKNIDFFIYLYIYILYNIWYMRNIIG